METVQQRDPKIPLEVALSALDIPKASYYRCLRPKFGPPKKRGPTRSSRRLSDTERQDVLTLLHSERYADQPPAEVYAELLEQGRYLASLRTMYRLLKAENETRERRNQRAPRNLPKPRLTANAPNEVWTWDISKLPTNRPGVYLNLYVIIDLYSRYIVAWMVSQKENSALAKQLFAEAIARYKVEPRTLTVHMDRGAPMTSQGFQELLLRLGVSPSYARPRISDDNPYSEAHFKTVKYQPDYPGRFAGLQHARKWFCDYAAWYNESHHHSGLGLYTPATVYLGQVEVIAEERQKALDRAYEAHPERFVKGKPKAGRPPEAVHINPVAPEPSTLSGHEVLAHEDLIKGFGVAQLEETTEVAYFPGDGERGSFTSFETAPHEDSDLSHVNPNAEAHEKDLEHAYGVPSERFISDEPTPERPLQAVPVTPVVPERTTPPGHGVLADEDLIKRAGVAHAQNAETADIVSFLAIEACERFASFETALDEDSEEAVRLRCRRAKATPPKVSRPAAPLAQGDEPTRTAGACEEEVDLL